VDAEREFIDTGLFTSQIENTDFWIRNTTVVTRLGVWLVLAYSRISEGSQESKMGSYNNDNNEQVDEP